MSQLGHEYAKALFELVDNKLDTLNELKAFSSSLDEESIRFFKHPKINQKDKKEMINKIGFSKSLTHFLYVIIDNNRFDLLDDISFEFASLYHNMNKIIPVKVYSKRPLSKDYVDRLTLKLKDKISNNIQVETVIDETIIAGIRVEYESKVIDQTVNNYFEEMVTSLKIGG